MKHTPVYVGQTTQPLLNRLHVHVDEKRENPKGIWIMNLTLAGERPQIVLLEECDVASGDYVEQSWINRFRERGFDLFNDAKYRPSNYASIVSRDVQVTKDQFIEWETLREHGDLKIIGALLGLASSGVSGIIQRRKGTKEQVDAIAKFYADRRAQINALLQKSA